MGWLSCRLSSYSVLEFRFPLNSVLYTYVVVHLYNRLRLTQNSTFVGPSGPELLLKSVSNCNRNYGFFLQKTRRWQKERTVPQKNGLLTYDIFNCNWVDTAWITPRLIRQYEWSLISCCYGNAVWCPRMRREVLGAGRMLSRRRAAATEDDDQ